MLSVIVTNNNICRLREHVKIIISQNTLNQNSILYIENMIPDTLPTKQGYITIKVF